MTVTSLKFYAGVDPGLDGAIALFEPVNSLLHVWDMPTVEILVTGKKKRRVDLHALARLIMQHHLVIAKGAIEEVGAMPGQGVTSMFNFGWSACAPEMAMACFGVPYLTIPPSRWKRQMRIGKDKEGARREASRLLPQHAANWARKKDDGRAEATLLAYWLAKQEWTPPKKEMNELM